MCPADTHDVQCTRGGSPLFNAPLRLAIGPQTFRTSDHELKVCTFIFMLPAAVLEIR